MWFIKFLPLRAMLLGMQLGMLLPLLVSCSDGGDPTFSAQPPQPALSEFEAARFLSQATFGPSDDAMRDLSTQGLEAWFLDQLQLPPSLILDAVLADFPQDRPFRDRNGIPAPGLFFLPWHAHWRTIIEADDQLRQRMAYALSQLLVVSSDSTVGSKPQSGAQYVDILSAGAFGNYRELLEAVTYSPAMAMYLTYVRNTRALPEIFIVPDENYAREILQLFTLGLVALNPDGTPALDEQGQAVELYDNFDITELAKVFTGLSFAGFDFLSNRRTLPSEVFHTPLETFDEWHSMEAKQVLGTTIPAGTGAEQSIDMALDAIFNHPNVGPFVGRQLIQRFITSAPTPAYVARVTAAFDLGSYTLPSGTPVGNGQRGDLSAVIAAVLFDSEARDMSPREEPGFGKLREPVLRFTHWARAFNINSAEVRRQFALFNTARPEALGQQPYRAPSVFNFYRPGYIAPRTETGDAGLTVPELQITSALSIASFPNFLSGFALADAPATADAPEPSFLPDYSAEMGLASDIDALLDLLDRKLTHGGLRTETRERVSEVLSLMGEQSEQERRMRVQVAVVMLMTSPEYIVLR